MRRLPTLFFALSFILMGSFYQISADSLVYQRELFGATLLYNNEEVSRPNFKLDETVDLAPLSLEYYNAQRNSRIAMIVFGTIGASILGVVVGNEIAGGDLEGEVFLIGLGAMSVAMTIPLGVKSRRNLRRTVEQNSR